MRIALEEGVHDELGLRVVDRQRKPRPRPGGHITQRMDAPLRRLDVHAVDDAQRDPSKGLCPRPRDSDHHLAAARGDMTNERLIDLGLDACQLLVERLDGSADAFVTVLPGAVDRGPHAGDDQDHELDHRGEEQVAHVLPLRGAREHRVDLGGRERAFRDDPQEKRRRAPLRVGFVNRLEQRVRCVDHSARGYRSRPLASARFTRRLSALCNCEESAALSCLSDSIKPLRITFKSMEA